jgi:hypothetical protein
MNWPAFITAVISVGSALSIASGNPALGAVLADPHTAEIATGSVGAIAAIISAFQHPVVRG